MATLIEKVQARFSRDNSTALGVYRAAIVAAAAGQDLGQKKLDELADALATLQLTPDDFSKDEATYRAYLNYKTALDNLPSAEEVERQTQELFTRQKLIAEQMEAFRREQGVNRSRIFQLGSTRCGPQESLNTILRDNPRLFA